ncbi:hypothetical protein QJQ45_010192 [Haematococcus lacustris]|nr:hypothetical protein QJQ45_010192 [Haematococcus lacustris]
MLESDALPLRHEAIAVLGVWRGARSIPVQRPSSPGHAVGCVLTKEQLKHNPTAPSLPKLPSLTGADKTKIKLWGITAMDAATAWTAALCCSHQVKSPTLLPMSIVDEQRTSRVSSAVNGQQPCERQLNKRRTTRPVDWKPPAGQVEQRMVRPAWSQRRDQPVRCMMWCPAVAPRKPPQAPRSSQEATQAAASEPGPSTPLPAKRSKRTKAEPAAEPTKGKDKAAKAKPAPQPGRWLDRDCNAALNMQRIGESKWRPLELCYWPEQGKLPAKGKEYSGLGYKRLRDKPPKAQQQQPAEAQ